MTQVQTPAGLRWIQMSVKITTLPKTKQLCYDVDISSNHPPNESERRIGEILAKHVKASFIEIAKEFCGAKDDEFRCVEASTPDEIAAVQKIADADIRRELQHE